MFKIAVITDEVSQDPAVAAAMVREFGGQGLEIRSAWEKGPHALDDADTARLREIAAAHALRICGIAAPVFKCQLGVAHEEREHLAMLRRCITLAHALNTDLIRVFTFWHQPGPPPWELIAEKFQEPIRLAVQEGITLGIENERSTMAATARRVADFLALMNHCHLRAIWVLVMSRGIPRVVGHIRPVMKHSSPGLCTCSSKMGNVSPTAQGRA